MIEGVSLDGVDGLVARDSGCSHVAKRLLVQLLVPGFLAIALSGGVWSGPRCRCGNFRGARPLCAAGVVMLVLLLLLLVGTLNWRRQWSKLCGCGGRSAQRRARRSGGCCCGSTSSRVSRRLLRSRSHPPVALQVTQWQTPRRLHLQHPSNQIFAVCTM